MILDTICRHPNMGRTKIISPDFDCVQSIIHFNPFISNIKKSSKLIDRIKCSTHGIQYIFRSLAVNKNLKIARRYNFRNKYKVCI